MHRDLCHLAPAALALGCLLASAALAEGAKDSATPLEVRVPTAPEAVKVGDVPELFYELHVTNYARYDLTLDDLTITDAASRSTLGDFKGAALDALLWRPGLDKSSPAFRRLAAGGLAVLYVETPLARSAPAPAALGWRLSVTNPDPSKSAKDLTPITGEIRVDRRAPLVIGFPFKGGDWVAANGPSNTSLHRRSVVQVNGTGRIAQRYAIDWIKLDPQGHAFHGDKAINANWADFGVEVVAVADGKVSASHDGLPENTPFNGRAVPITLETVGGNYLMVDLGGGRYAFYAHLQPGTQRVHVGDVVHRGDVLALLGNTGNSDAPHLHFHIANANAPLGSEGVPYVFESYEKLGKMVDPSGWKAEPGETPVARRDSLPAEDEVVRVP
jgi:murein DD-endopeptidase MepM/ murein hydrolase activator NlpD